MWNDRAFPDRGGPPSPAPVTFAILDTAHIVGYLMDAYCAGAVITGPQLRLALHLLGTPYGKPNDELALRLGVSAAAVSQMVRRMQFHGLVTSEEPRVDGRSHTIVLTERGARDARNSRRALVNFDRRLAMSLGAGGTASLLAALETIAGRTREQGPSRGDFRDTPPRFRFPGSDHE